MKLDIPYKAYQNDIKLRKGMVHIVSDFINRSSLWSKGDGNGLLFKATHITPSPNNVNPSKDEIVRVLNILSVQNGIPLRTLKALISAESDFRQFDDKSQPLIAPQSYSSAAGLGQVTKTTARLYGEDYEKLQINWKYNLKVAIKIFKAGYDHPWNSNIADERIRSARAYGMYHDGFEPKWDRNAYNRTPRGLLNTEWEKRYLSRY